ncbi:MAG: hypothetical protein ACOCQG_01130 [Candidatus Nanoarchaeia archaeon]
MKRGILFSTDAMIALFIFISTITGLFVILNQVDDSFFKNRELYDLGYDSLEIMKSKGMFSNAIESESGEQELVSFLWDFLPRNVCSQIKLQDKFKFTYKGSLKPGCRPADADNETKIRLPFIYDNRIFNVEMILWYR